MKILLLGKNGQVGWELQRSLQPLGEVLALDAYSQDYCGDLADIEGLGVTLQRHRPDVIVNAAAYTAVDQAESDTESYPTPAPRPLNSRLATEKLQLAFSVALPNWKSGVDRMLNEFLGRSHEKA